MLRACLHINERRSEGSNTLSPLPGQRGREGMKGQRIIERGGWLYERGIYRVACEVELSVC